MLLCKKIKLEIIPIIDEAHAYRPIAFLTNSWFSSKILMCNLNYSSDVLL
jgi:hypothetical protein